MELRLDDFRGGDGVPGSGTKREVRIAVPFSNFYINQIQRDTNGSGGGGSGSSTLASPIQQTQTSASNNSIVRVLEALQVPEHGSWAKVLDVLQQQQSRHDEAERALRDQLELLRLQSSANGQSPQSQSETLLEELRRATDELQATALPQIEEIVATNAETLERVLVRLRAAVDDWYEQSGWSVQLRSA